MSGIITDPNEAVSGGFKSILAFEGDLMSLTKEDNTFDTTREQLRFEFENVAILEMEEGEPEPELEDDRFHFWVGYAKKGRKPNKNSVYVRAILPSAKAAGVDLDKVIASEEMPRVTMRRTEIPLGFKAADTGEEVVAVNYTFVGAGEVSVESIEDHARGLILGKTPPAALRDLVMDSRTKNDQGLRQAIQKGNYEVLGVMLGEDGRFVQVVEGEVVSETVEK